MSHRSCIFFLTTLAIVGTAFGLRGILNDRYRTVRTPTRTTQLLRESNLLVVDVEVVQPSVGTVPSSSGSANRLALIKSLQGGLARVFEVVPRPLLYAITAVVSGMLFFEMSRFVALFSVPVLIVLGARESMLEDDQIDYTEAMSVNNVGNDEVAIGTHAVVRQSINSHGEQVQSGDQLNEISMRVADAQASMTDARSAASNLKERIASFQERIKDLNLGY